MLLLLKVNPKKYEEVSRVELSRWARMARPTRRPSRCWKIPCWAAPILSHGLLYVRGKDRLVCLELIPQKK